MFWSKEAAVIWHNKLYSGHCVRIGCISENKTALVPPKLPFGLGLAAINEVRKRIYYSPDDIFVFSINQTCILKLWQGKKNLATKMNEQYSVF